MSSYAYIARDGTGRHVADTVQGASKDAVLQELREKGLRVTRITEQKAAAKKGMGEMVVFKGGVKLRHLSMFFRQFATMINAGIGLVRCLDILQQQTPSYRLKDVTREVQSEIEGGASLSLAMTKHPRVFSPLAQGLIKAGEVGGVLDETMDRLALFVEKDLELRRSVRTALTYPILVLVFATGIVVGLMTLVVPKFIGVFEDLGLDIETFPKPTLLLMAFSDFLLLRWWAALIIIVAVVVVFRQIRATRIGKRVWDIVMLRLPILGNIVHQLAMARFSRTLGTLLGSGVPILQALETTAGTTGNVVIGEALLAARTNIREGAPIADPLAASRHFPPMVTQMVSVGEETGQLDTLLEKVADFYEEEVDAALEGLTRTIEPIMIVLLGGIVLFIVVSIWLPMLSVISQMAE